jgi:hypothetical protein
VSGDGNTIAIGAITEDSMATGINGTRPTTLRRPPGPSTSSRGRAPPGPSKPMSRPPIPKRPICSDTTWP